MLEAATRAGQGHVHRRHDKEREQGANGQATENHQAHGLTASGTGAGGDHQRHDAKHHGRRGHEDRAQTGGCGLLNGLAFGFALRAQVIGHLDDENAVLADEAHERDQTHLGVDVDRGKAQEDEAHGTKQGQGHRDQDHHRVAEALELRGQGQEHDHHGKEQSQRKATRFLHELARLASVVHRVAGGGDCLDDVAHGLQDIALRSPRNAGDGDRVQLLKAVDGLGHHVVAQRGHGGGRHLRAVGQLDVEVQQVRGIEAIDLLHLRDDLVGAAIDGEVVDIAAAQRGRHVIAKLLHAQAHGGDLVAIGHHGGLRLVELEVSIDEVKHLGLACLVHHLLRHRIEVLEGLGGGDDELHRQARRARQGRELEGRHACASDVVPLGLEVLLDLMGAA